MDTCPIFVILFDSLLIRDRCYSALLRYKTAKQSAFFSKSVKKSVKRGVRVLSARASHARRVCKAREKKPYFQRLSPVSLSVFSLVPDLLFDCSRILEYAKIRTALQSTPLQKPQRNTVLVCDQKPYPVWLLCWRKRVQCERQLSQLCRLRQETFGNICTNPTGRPETF